MESSNVICVHCIELGPRIFEISEAEEPETIIKPENANRPNSPDGAFVRTL